MKKLFFLILICNLWLQILPGINNISHAQVNPWPWSKPLRFPWESIQGTWSESSSRFTFSFQVITNSWGEHTIKIKQYDAKTGEKIAEGKGFENTNGVVVAGMTGGQIQREYLLTVRTFQNLFCGGKRKITGVTIETYDNQLVYHFEIHKITEIPLTQPNIQEYIRPLPDSIDESFSCDIRN